jgi:hypothetical protein
MIMLTIRLWQFFYTGLAAYIENTIEVYNSITEADIENALNRRNTARYNAPDIPVSDVGEYKFEPVPDTGKLLETVRWDQGSPTKPYNTIINAVKRPPDPDYYHYITGCGATAIAIIMAFHGKPEASALSFDTEPLLALVNNGTITYNNWPTYTYNWVDMRLVDANIGRYPKAEEAIGVLMYEIGIPENANSSYTWGYISEGNDPKKKGKGASTNTYNSGVKRAFENMGYHDPGSFKTYSLKGVQDSIDTNKPVIAGGHTELTKILWFTFGSGDGHYWVIDGYQQYSVLAKNDKGSKVLEEYTDYVHCNLGWYPGFDIYDPDDRVYRFHSKNGWFISGVFDTNNIPVLTRSGTDGFFKYAIKMLANITAREE